MGMSPTDCSHCSSEGGQNLSWNSLDLSVVIQCIGNIFLHLVILTACLGLDFLQWLFALKRKSEKENWFQLPEEKVIKMLP